MDITPGWQERARLAELDRAIMARAAHLRDQLARIRYDTAAQRNGWRQSWAELSEADREWWRTPMRGAN